MDLQKFTLRELQPTDSPALVKLISDFDSDMTTQFRVDAYDALIFGSENQTLGVGVECEGVEGLVGLGTVRLGQVQFNGATLPLAFLDGLKVRPDFRGQGLGYQIANWRVQRAREAWGEECVIATGMARGNEASRGVARKWCREFVDGAFIPRIAPLRKRPPRIPAGIEVRELAPREFEEFAARQNSFYRDYQLYPPSNPQSIAYALAVSAAGKKPYSFYTAADAQGNLLAGAQVWRRGLLKEDVFSNPPLPLRLLNNLVHILPSDFIVRDAAVAGLWHKTGQEKAARLLWEFLRWELRSQATMLGMSLDPRDPLLAVLGNNPWYIPRFTVTIALRGPTAMDRGKLLFGYGRV